jgi:hypothetical protein
MTLDMAPISPKLTPQDKRKSLYPYYAGYSEAFVDWALDRMDATAGESLLDPWNGTGTTTAVGAARGLIVTGIDINPVLSFVARARLATSDDRAMVREWAKTLEDYEGAVLAGLVQSYHQIRGKAGFVQGSPADALFVVGMFPTVRQAFHSLRTKNPSWYSDKRMVDIELSTLLSTSDDIRNGILHTCLRQEAQRSFSPSHVTIINSDLQLVTLPSESYDHILTSPPYLTRIDYVQATLPELCLLDAIEISTPRSYLRKRMIGTPLTSTILSEEIECLPAAARNILNKIKNHESKASQTYYWRFFSKYFIDMWRALAQIADAMRIDGRLCLVTQPSFYKDVLIDLPLLLTDMGLAVGLELESSVEFDSKNSMVSVNKRAKAASGNRPNETAAFYQRVRKKR